MTPGNKSTGRDRVGQERRKQLLGRRKASQVCITKLFIAAKLEHSPVGALLGSQADGSSEILSVRWETGPLFPDCPLSLVCSCLQGCG